MNYIQEREIRVQDEVPEQLIPKSVPKNILPQIPPSAAEMARMGLTEAAKKAPATPLMVSPVAAWRRLCAHTGGGIHVGTFYRWIRTGRLYTVRMGGKILVPLESLDVLIKHCLTGEKL